MKILRMEFFITRATLEHSKLIWEWRNNELTRSMFRNSELVSWQDHESWFEKLLLASNRYIYVGYLHDKPSGVVRFDLIDGTKGDYEVSINISPDYRGIGIGKLILSSGIQNLRKENKLLSNVIAEVRKGNIASTALFESAGFEKHDEKADDFACYKLEIS